MKFLLFKSLPQNRGKIMASDAKYEPLRARAPLCADEEERHVSGHEHLGSSRRLRFLSFLSYLLVAVCSGAVVLLAERHLPRLLSSDFLLGWECGVNLGALH